MPEMSRQRAQALLAEGRVQVTPAAAPSPRAAAALPPTCRASTRVAAGDRIAVLIPVPQSTSAPQPQALAVPVVYQDADLAIVDKPRGMVTHPAPGNPDGTLVNALMSCCRDLSGIGGVIRPGIVHRLDRGTSGLLVIAKNDASHRHLASQLSARTASRGYVALVKGDVHPAHGSIVAAIGRDPNHRKRFAVREDGRPAHTDYRVLAHWGAVSVVSLKLQTGRTHQIRVHMSWVGHPVVGDQTYGRSLRGGKSAAIPQAVRNAVEQLGGCALHAETLRLRHPRTGGWVGAYSPLPGDLVQLFAAAASAAHGTGSADVARFSWAVASARW
ncbi:MAG: RluA family pseudouridine synthase [Candidatus Schekmanbacteria bacterium]|nr:RluA family pseudouridine synthase [Candidatus Schekmanbacteria bacterium]